MASAVYGNIYSRWEYENGEFTWSFSVPEGGARIEFPLINGRKTVTLNGVEFTAKQLCGKIIDKKLVFELNSGDYIAK